MEFMGMPMTESSSDTIGTVPGKGLITRIIAVFFTFFSLIAGVLMLLTYLIAFSTLERENRQYLEQTMNMADVVITSQLDNIQQSLVFMTSEEDLHRAISANDTGGAEEALYALLELDSFYLLDVLFITKPGQGVWVDAALSYPLSRSVVAALGDGPEAFENWQMVLLGSEREPEVLLLRAAPMILQSTGKVIGYLWGGLVLNKNVSLVETVRDRIHVADVGFFLDGNFLVSTSFRDKEHLSQFKQSAGHAILSGKHKDTTSICYARDTGVFDSERKVTILIVVESVHFQTLKDTYAYLLLALAVILFFAGVAGGLIIRKIIRAPLENLLDYSKRASREQMEPFGFAAGNIREFNQLGMVVGAMVQQIREKQESLSRAQAIANVGNWDLDIGDQSMRWSDEIYRILGLESGVTEAGYDDFVSAVHPDDRVEFNAAVSIALENHSAYSIEHRIVRPDGTIRWVHEKGHVFKDSNGTPVKLLGTVQDITEARRIREELDRYREGLEQRVRERTEELTAANRQLRSEILEREQAEKALIQAKNAADAANQTKGRFLANMSHEIRTPMNSVIGYIDLSLENRDLDQSIRRNLEIASRSARALLHLLSDILDISKIEAGKMTMENIKFNLPQMLNDVLASFEARVREKGLELECRFHPDLSRCYLGDPDRLSQVLINLIGNAVKFTEKGKITVSVEPVQEHMLHFMIQDTGIGIPQEHLGTIFEPFSQADPGTTRRFGGTGLGTTISRQVVEMMGGRIWVESHKGQGSIFHFTVAVPESECSATCTSDCERYSSRADEEPEPLFTRTFKVLLAEDILENAELVRIKFQQHGHRLIHVWNGQQALDAVARETFDVILMDIQMPEVDGLEATRRIRSMESETRGRIPIIALTASVMQEEKERCFAVGMDAVVGKPLNFIFLFSEMERLIPDYGGVSVIPDVSVKSGKHESREPMRYDLPGVDTEKGLTLWGSVPAYEKALRGFAGNASDLSGEIRSLFESGHHEKAYQRTHALKGVSGNLALPAVYLIVSDLTVALKDDRHTEVMALLDKLERAMAEVLAGLCKLPGKEDPDGGGDPEPDQGTLAELLVELIHALDQDDPGVAEPVLDRLGRLLPQNLLKPVAGALETFDFIEAREETVRLAGQLNIDLQETP